MLADDRDTENAVAARLGEHLHEAVRRAVGDRAVEIVDAVLRDLVGDVLLLRLLLVEADARDFGIDERAPRNDAVVGLELLERAEQRIDRGEPRLVRRHVRELERARHVAAGPDVRDAGAQVLVGLDGLAGRDAEFLQPVAFEPRHAADRADEPIELDALLEAAFPAPPASTTIAFAVAVALDAQRLVPDQHVHAVMLERGLGQCRHLLVLADHHARQHLDLRHLRAEPREGLRQLAADRAAAEHDQPLRQLAQLPQVVGGQHLDLVEPRQRRHERTRAGGEHDVLRRQPLRGALVGRDLDGPGVDQLGVAAHHVDAEAAIAFDRIVRLDRADHAVHAVHHLGEAELRAGLGDAVVGGMADLLDELGAADQRLARHAAVVQAVAAHLAVLDQRHLGLHRRADVARHEPGRAGADDDQVAVEALRPRMVPARVDLARAAPLRRPSWRSAERCRAARTSRSAPATGCRAANRSAPAACRRSRRRSCRPACRAG